MNSRRLLLFPLGKLAVAAVLMSFAALPVFAQQEMEPATSLAAPSATQFATQFATPSAMAMPSAMALAPAMTIPAPESKKVGRTIDSKYLFLFAMAAALTVTDIELTQHCLQAGTCHEANILYGNNPTRARMYAFNLPVLGSQAVLSAWLKRRHPERSYWMVPPIADSVAHGVGTITGVTK